MDTPPRKRLQASLAPRAESASEYGPDGMTSAIKLASRGSASVFVRAYPFNSLTPSRSECMGDLAVGTHLGITKLRIRDNGLPKVGPRETRSCCIL